jgi:uncharacterized membrane protein
MRPERGGPREGHPAEVVGRNIDRIIALEERVAGNRSWAERASEALGSFVGTFWFVAVHLAGITLWIAINARWLPWTRPFDPYPFNLLSTIASAEAVIVSAFVMMKQNRMSRIGDRRDHLDLQVNLLAEQEASLTIQMLARIGRKLGVDPDEHAEALRLSRTATLEHLVEELHRRLPERDARAR